MKWVLADPSLMLENNPIRQPQIQTEIQSLTQFCLNSTIHFGTLSVFFSPHIDTYCPPTEWTRRAPLGTGVPHEWLIKEFGNNHGVPEITHVHLSGTQII